MSSTREVVKGFTDEQINILLSQLDPLITANYLGRSTEDCYELTAFLPSEAAGIETANAWRRVPYLIRQLRAALRQREEEVRAEGWLPIESAPKGRKLIVGYFNPLGNWRSVIGRYYLDGTLESETDKGGFAPEGWYEETEAYEYLMQMDQEPTYYRSLPPPPAIRRDSQPQEGE
jgi:hypothetical protein